MFTGAVEVEPSFIGDYQQFFHNNLHFTQGMKPGKVFISFIVNTDGPISDINVLRGLGPLNNSEAVRVLKLSRWCSGRKTVKVMYTIPILFTDPAQKDQ